MNQLRAALINFSPAYGNIEANLVSLEAQVLRLASDGVQIACFPEMCLTGYGRSAEVLDHAQELDGSAIGRLTDLAKRTGITIVAGMPEWEPIRQRIYITQFFCLPDGQVFSYRKCHLSPRETKIFHAGEELGVFNLISCMVGMQLCYDAHFPEFSLAQALSGAQIILVCSASPMGNAGKLRESWLRYLPARAYDTGCYVLTCNQHYASPSGLLFSGLAMAFDPNGKLIAETQGPDQPLIVDLDFGFVDETRQKRSFLRLRRPELYNLLKSSGITI